MENNKKIKISSDKLRQLAKRYLPAALTVVSSWFPGNIAQSTNRSFPENETKTELLVKNALKQQETAPDLLALASPSAANSFNHSLLKISVKTEASPKFANPAATATGNGYYGQHQFGSTAGSDFAVKKYIAYALINSSNEFRDAIAANLLSGTNAKKQKLIDDFSYSAEQFAERGELENAYYSRNPAYAALAKNMQVTPSKFSKAMNASAEESQHTQEMFIYEVYLYQMTNDFKTLQKNHPRIDFTKIHPAVLGSAVAIAIKTGNGNKFNAALSVLDKDLEKKDKAALLSAQKKIDETWRENILNDLSKGNISQADADILMKYKTEAVVDRSGLLTADNVKISGQTLTIYDPSGKIEKDMILAKKGITVNIVKKNAPARDSLQMQSAVHIIDRSKVKADVSLINNDQWLKNYCRSTKPNVDKLFRKVYAQAAPMLDKVPTLETMYEISIMLRRPDIYEMYQTVRPLQNQEKNTAQAKTNDIFVRDKIIELRENKTLAALKKAQTLQKAEMLMANAQEKVTPTKANLAAVVKKKINFHS